MWIFFFFLSILFSLLMCVCLCVWLVWDLRIIMYGLNYVVGYGYKDYMENWVFYGVFEI